VARDYSWGRQSTSVDTTSSGRLALGGGFIAAAATLERVIFGYHLYQDCFWGGKTAGPTHTSLVAGILLVSAASGAPTIDPVSTPGADWLWVGVLSSEVIPLRYADKTEYRVAFSCPAEQLQTEARRKGPVSDFGAVWMMTQPLSTLNSAFPRWRGSSYISSLYSVPA